MFLALTTSVSHPNFKAEMKTILIIDDDNDISENIAEVLTLAGFPDINC